MRTRFLNTDHFTPSSSSPIQTLAFLNLPVPHLSLSPSCDDDRDPLLLLLLRLSVLLHVSLDLHQLPIHSALSKFFSDVIPQPIDVDPRCFEAVRSAIRAGEEESGILYEEKEEKSGRAFGSESSKKENETACDGKCTHGCEVIQFETPELVACLENDFLNENEEIQLPFEVLEIDNNLDILNSGLVLWYPNEVQESVYSVEDVALDYQMEQNSYKLEDDGSSPNQMLFQCITFPLFEVDEICLGILTSHSMEDELLLLLENTEHQHGTQTDFLINGKEILGSLEYDISDLLSENSLSNQCLNSEMALLDFPEVDFISMVDSSQLKEISEFHQVMADGDCFPLISPVIFQEFQMFDLDSSQVFEVFFSTQKNSEEVTCKWMFKDVNFKNFNDLIVSHELALVDDAFTSLPIPVLSEPEETKSVYAVVEEILAGWLKPQPLSASDGIYLDWHLIEKDKCSGKIFYPRQKMLEEMDFRKIDLDLNFFDDGKLVSDFIFCDDALTRPNVEGYEQPLNINYDSMLDGQLMGVTSGELFDNGSPKPGNGEQSAEKIAERASFLFKSMSQSNELEFFLNPRKAISGEKVEFAGKKINTVAPSSNSMSTCVPTGTQLHQWDFTLHKIKLSDHIVALVDIFEKSYLTILQNETKLSSLLASDDFKLLSLPKQQMMSHINEKLLQNATCLGDENIEAYVILCSIKQMAWYTCFYGIHPARLYVDKLCQSLDCLKPRLGLLQQLIVDADRKVDKDMTRSHPSLPVIQGILRSNTTHSNVKVLILAEKVFWWSLKSLLTSMGLSCNDPENFSANVDNVSEFAKAAMDALLASDCLLVSYELISASFPFNKFSLIMEYGGSNGSSRIYSLSPKLAGLPMLHFLNVELDDSTASRALCEGVDMRQNMEVEGEFGSVETPNESMQAQKLQKLQEVLNFVPVEDGYLRSQETADKVEACCMPQSVPFSPSAMESEHIQQMRSYPDALIIVNTQSFEKEMIISRRSTYQRILAMEKEAVQVVERDSDLPVDVIISPAICLVWYDCINIGRKASALDEASSCLPLCVDNIATNVLTLLSFTFNGCILVFEGETSFISTVMESSDGLYAAAASLGIDLQLFYSHTSELTDEIIVSCIRNSIKLTRGLYPKMPESESVAESFLTKFPSVNPLSVHAMLSSVGTLIEFFDCSHEHRIKAMPKYHVSDESIILFSALCKYGEREDSKSIMTDCSSSVSSGPDSGKCHLDIDFGRKQGKCISSPDNIDKRIDDLLHFEPLDQVTNGVLNPSGVSRPYNSWKDPEIFDDHCKPSSSFNDLFGKDQELEFDLTMKPSRISKPYDSRILEGTQVSKEIRGPLLFSKDNMSGQKRGSKIARMNNLDWHNGESNNLFEDFTGEVVDLTSNALSGKDLSSLPMSSCLSASMLDINSERKSKIARRLSFGKSYHLTFPTAAEINSGSDTLNPNFLTAAKINSDSEISSFFKHTRGGSSQKPYDHPDTDYKNAKLLTEQQKMPLEGVLVRRFGSSKGGSFQEEISHYGRTPLSDAIHSAHPQPGSPWTIEFLNRIREKSRLRQQSLPCDSLAPSFGISGNISKATKRRSPSILEFFKYQGGSTPRNLPERKKQKQSMQSSISSENKRLSASFLPTRTPIDKRARQTLSFTMNEGNSQTKLVWSDESPHDPRKRFQR